MSSVVKIEQVEGKVMTIRETPCLIDSDVAEMYGVETKRINEAVKNNLDKFPADYMFEISEQEAEILRSKFSTSSWGGRRYPPKAFTEKGLYMLATILKSKQAKQTTFAIIETFARIRRLSRSMRALTDAQSEAERKALMQESGEIIAEVLDDDLEITDKETTVELNVAFLKVKHTIKQKKKQ